MSCNVCIGISDYDSPEVYNASTPKARKPHRCCECGGEIPKGDQYERVKWHDGKWGRQNTCLLCVEIRKVFSCGEGFVHEMLWEDMEEYAFPELTTGTDCFQELSAAAKAVVLNRWRKWKGL